MDIFGFEVKKRQQEPVSFAPKVTDDGAVVVSEGGAYGTYIDMDGSIRNEAELVNKYRDMAEYPEIDMAVDDIVNEVITQEPEVKLVELILDDLKQPDRIKNLLVDEFDNVLELLDMTDLAYDVFRRWYVDGRLYYHAIIDEQTPSNGIIELRYIDPRKIRKVKEQKRRKTIENVQLNQTSMEYFIYNDKGFSKTSGSTSVPSNTLGGIKIAKDSIIHCTSGLTNVNGDMVQSYLHKAIKPLNQLRSMEDSLVIYRISRAPERRIFYIDVGNLPKQKAEQYLRDTMVRFKNKLVYDAATGEVRDDRKHMTMLEDFWLPRRGDGKGTEITTMPGGMNLGQIDDVIYFQKRLYRSLNVPTSRLDPEVQFNLGRATEITRDEIKFAKFINRLRNKFSQLFLKILEKQLVFKGIIQADEWTEFKNSIRFKFATDNFYAELKETEILRDRVAMLRDIDDYATKYYSHEWIRRHVLRQSDEDMAEINAQIKVEKDDPQYAQPVDGETSAADAMAGGGQDSGAQPGGPPGQ